MGATSTPPIAILGAGPSGLMLGRLLEVANIDYIIYERENTAFELNQGGSLDIHQDSGQWALKEAGLFDEFKALARFDAPMRMADKQGKTLVHLGADGDDTDRPEIDRKHLRSLLVDSIPPHRIHWNSRVREVTRDAEKGMTIHFENGNVESGFRLVVGADGSWSKARKLITDATPQYSGWTYMVTWIRPGDPVHSKVQSLAGRGNYIAFGSEKLIVAQCHSDDSYMIGVGLTVPETWAAENRDLMADGSALRQWLLAGQLSDWEPINTDLIEHSTNKFHHWPLYAMPTESLCWETVPGVTLIGDAAHVTTPFVGEGVNCAMYDSVELAQKIKQYGLDDLDRAVEEYEQSMFPRGIDLIRRSTESGDLMFEPNAPREWLQWAARTFGRPIETEA